MVTKPKPILYVDDKGKGIKAHNWRKSSNHKIVKEEGIGIIKQPENNKISNSKSICQ